MKKHIQILMLILGAQYLLGILYPQFILVHADDDFTIVWKANTEPDLAGYNVYQSIGDPGPPYDFLIGYDLDEIDDPDDPEIVLTLSEENIRNYIVMTAFDKDGFESEFSNEICVIMQNANIVECEFAKDDDNNSGDNDNNKDTGGSSGHCFISTFSKSFF
jgi:hypothetical protein